MLGVKAVYRDILFFKLAGIKHIIGAPLTRDLDSGKLDSVTGLIEQESKRLSNCLKELGYIDIADKVAWDLKYTPDELHHALSILGDIGNKPFIVVNAGGKVDINDWGNENWKILLSQLSQTLSCPLVFIGGLVDIDRANLLGMAWNGKVINTCGQLSPRETGALLSHASLFFGHDSGPMHLAAANSVPCICVFSNNNPAGKWYPYSPNVEHTIYRNEIDIKQISPANVMAGILYQWRRLYPVV